MPGRQSFLLCVPSIVLGLVLLTNFTCEIAIWNKKRDNQSRRSIDRHKTLALPKFSLVSRWGSVGGVPLDSHEFDHEIQPFKLFIFPM